MEYYREYGKHPEVWVFDGLCYPRPKAIAYLIENGYSENDAIEYLELVKEEVVTGIKDSLKLFTGRQTL